MSKSIANLIETIGDRYAEVIVKYKTQECKQVASGEEKCNNGDYCRYYHSPAERRREVFNKETGELAYSPNLCESVFRRGRPCEAGDKCPFAHTLNEQFFHPLHYKMVDKDELLPNKHLPAELIPYKLPGEKVPTEEQRESLLRLANVASPAHEEKKTKNEDESTSAPNLNPSPSITLSAFKVHKCTKGDEPHDYKKCPFYHNESDRRRDPSLYNYSCEACIDHKKTAVPPDHCPWSHNKIEELYHPDRYKTKFCQCYPNRLSECKYDDFCSFAHRDEEIQVELLHKMNRDANFYKYKYKTVTCPFVFNHDRKECVYAHNPQDMRRRPTQYHYEPVQCKLWKTNNNDVKSYEDGGCPNGMMCKRCHGRKERDYHPDFFKTQKCRDDTNCIKRDCPYYHSDPSRDQSCYPSIFGDVPREIQNLHINGDITPSHSWQPLSAGHKYSYQESLPDQLPTPHNISISQYSNTFGANPMSDGAFQDYERNRIILHGLETGHSNLLSPGTTPPFIKTPPFSYNDALQLEVSRLELLKKQQLDKGVQRAGSENNRKGHIEGPKRNSFTTIQLPSDLTNNPPQPNSQTTGGFHRSPEDFESKLKTNPGFAIESSLPLYKLFSGPAAKPKFDSNAQSFEPPGVKSNNGLKGQPATKPVHSFRK